MNVNEIDRVTLLERDLYIQFRETNRLRRELEKVMGCPECGDVMTELRENVYGCLSCRIVAEQTTIFSPMDEVVGRKKSYRNEFGFYIKSQRVQMGYSQKEFSELIGVSAPTLSEWERGKHKPQREHAVVSKIKGLWKQQREG